MKGGVPVFGFLFFRLLVLSLSFVASSCENEKNRGVERDVDLVLKSEHQFLVREYTDSEPISVDGARKTNVTESIYPENVAVWTLSKWFHQTGREEGVDSDFENKFREAISFKDHSYREAKHKAGSVDNAEKTVRLVKRLDMGRNQATGRPRSALVAFELTGFADNEVVEGSILLNFDAYWPLGNHEDSFIARNWDFRGKRKIVTEVLSALPGE